MWVNPFAHSAKVNLLWKERMASYSTTRWWSKWEVMDQVLKYFGDIELFLAENDDVSPTTRATF